MFRQRQPAFAAPNNQNRVIYGSQSECSEVTEISSTETPANINESCLTYYLAHWFIFTLFAIGCLTAFGILNFKRVGPFTSAYQNYSWRDDIDPFYFGTTADIHISHAFPERLPRTIEFFNLIDQNFNPPIFTAIGDLVDASAYQSELMFHQQYIGNWLNYEASRDNSSFYNEDRVIIESAGNHDMFIVPVDNPLHNKYRRFCLEDNEEFGVRTYSFKSYPRNVQLVRFNPLRPPNPSTPFGVMPFIHKYDLDALDNAVAPDSNNVLLIHWPYYQNFAWRSSNGKSRQDIFNRFDVYMSGHIHPDVIEIVRFENTLSVVSCALIDSEFFTITTVDHGYSRVLSANVHNNATIMITYPIPKEQLTSRVSFNQKYFPVRAMLFGEEMMNLSVELDNVSLGRMTFLREIRRSVRLFSLNVTILLEGEHQLVVSGDNGVFEKINFVIGSTAPAVFDSARLYQTSHVLWGMPLALLIFLLLHIIPWWNLCTGQIDSFENFFLRGEGSIPWYKQLYLGPLYQISRVRRVKGLIKVVVYAVSFMPWVMPMFFMKIKDLHAQIWIYGNYAGGELRPYSMIVFLYMIYLFFYALPVINQACLFYERDDPFDLVRKIEYGVLCLGPIACLIFWVIITFVAGHLYATFVSPMFYLIIWVFAAMSFELFHQKEEQDELRKQKQLNTINLLYYK